MAGVPAGGAVAPARLAGPGRDRDAGRRGRRLRPRRGRGVPGAEEAERLAYLGPDLLGADWDADEAVRRIAVAPDAPIAVALAEQRNLAGLGNEYVNELCFLRGIRPTRPAGEVDLPPLVDLAQPGDPRQSRPDRTHDDRQQPPRRALWVYSRAASACRRCGTRIEHGRLGRNELELRNTWWCPSCQR